MRVMHRHVQSRLAECQRDRLAQPNSTARNQSGALFELHATAIESTRALCASCRSSHSAGTFIIPSLRGPSSDPCQSEPPLGSREKNSISARILTVSSDEWLG